MRFIRNLFGGKPKPDLPFQVDDKVRDLWGQILVVTEIDPTVDHGLGIVRTRNAAGVESAVALISHHFIVVDKNTSLSSASLIARRVRPDELAASVYLRSNMIVLHGVCQTSNGGFNCEPYRCFETTISDLILGTELLRVLKEASAMPIPANLKIEQKKFFDVCKVRSWSKLCENAVYCHIIQTPNQMEFLPAEREGPGFSHLPKLTIQIAATSTQEEVGRALRNCFQICK
jgi:hypothetical protein